MIREDEVQRLQSAKVYTTDGEKIGGVDEVYLDDETGAPEWLTVSTGWFGTSTSFVPLNDAAFDADGNVQVPYAKEKVKDAPRTATGGHLSRQEEEELYRYYGRDYVAAEGYREDREGTYREGTYREDREGFAESGVRTGEVADEGRVAGHRTVGDRVVGDGDRVEDASTMTRSEERLNVGTQTHETGRARLRKYVTTEDQSVTVPVKKEVLSVERESLGDGEVRRGGIIEDDSAVEEVVLREERPVVDKETVEAERVRVGKEEVTDQHTVTEQVRQDQIDIEGEEKGRRR